MRSIGCDYQMARRNCIRLSPPTPSKKRKIYRMKGGWKSRWKNKKKCTQKKTLEHKRNMIVVTDMNPEINPDCSFWMKPKQRENTQIQETIIERCARETINRTLYLRRHTYFKKQAEKNVNVSSCGKKNEPKTHMSKMISSGDTGGTFSEGLQSFLWFIHPTFFCKGGVIDNKKGNLRDLQRETCASVFS